MDDFEAINKIWPSVETEKTWPLDTIKWVLSNSTKATLWTVSKYALDILDSWSKSIRNFSSLASPSKYKKYWLRNIPKSLISGSSEAITTIKNATIWWVIWWTGHLYKHWIQNNVKTLTNWTTEWIPWIGENTSEIINFCFTLPAGIPHILNELSRNIHKPLNKLNKMSPDWKRSKVRLRI